MKRFNIYCGRRKSLICIQFIMGSKKFFRRFEIQIKKLFQIDLFFFIFNTFKFIIKFIITLILSHVIIILNNIFNFLIYNFNKL